MNTETLTELQPSDKTENYNKRKYYILFDQKTGKIKKISNSVQQVPHGMMQTQSWNPVCKHIIKGKQSIKKYGMIWDIQEEKYDIDYRSTTLMIESIDNKLQPFSTEVDPTVSEMFVKVLYEDNQVLVEVNKDNIKNIKNLSDITEISTSENKLLDIFITKKLDPDYLIDIVEVDPLTLFKNGKQLIELNSDISTKVDWSNISLYSKSVFNNYGWTLQSSLNKNQQFLGTKRVLQCNTVADKSNININVVDNILHIGSDISENELYYFEGKNKLRFVVCDGSIDKLVGAFELTSGQLLQRNSTLSVGFDWPSKPILLYKNNYITVNTNGELINDTND
jgi:hypothetical protein